MIPDVKPPVSVDWLYSNHRPDLLALLKWAQLVDEEDAEDFLHEFYLHERRRDRLSKWGGRCMLSSWILGTMRRYRNNIIHGWWESRPLYDYSRPWSAWTDSTSTLFDTPIQLNEYRELYPQHRETLEHLLSDKSIIELDKWRSRAHQKVEEMRHDLSDGGPMLGASEYQLSVDRTMVYDVLA